MAGPGRPPGAQNKDKPFRDAIRMEAALAETGVLSPAKEGSLRYIARQLLIRAGEETQAAAQVGDRLDGKPAQAIVGDSEHDPISSVTEVRTTIVDPRNPEGASVHPATDGEPV